MFRRGRRRGTVRARGGRRRRGPRVGRCGFSRIPRNFEEDGERHRLRLLRRARETDARRETVRDVFSTRQDQRPPAQGDSRHDPRERRLGEVDHVGCLDQGRIRQRQGVGARRRVPAQARDRIGAHVGDIAADHRVRPGRIRGELFKPRGSRDAPASMGPDCVGFEQSDSLQRPGGSRTVLAHDHARHRGGSTRFRHDVRRRQPRWHRRDDQGTPFDHARPQGSIFRRGHQN